MAEAASCFLPVPQPRGLHRPVCCLFNTWAVFHDDDYVSPSSISAGNFHEFQLLYSTEGLLLLLPKAPVLMLSHSASSCSPQGYQPQPLCKSLLGRTEQNNPDRGVRFFSLFYGGSSICVKGEREDRVRSGPSPTQKRPVCFPRAEPEEYFHFSPKQLLTRQDPHTDTPGYKFTERTERHPNYLPFTSGARQPR